MYNVANDFVPLKRVIIESFDQRVLKYYHKTFPKVTLSIVVENEDSPESIIKSLGFKPDIYSPEYKLLKPNSVTWLHANGIRVVPWTVNDVDEMNKLIKMKVDGIITDYPDLIMATSDRK